MVKQRREPNRTGTVVPASGHTPALRIGNGERGCGLSKRRVYASLPPVSDWRFAGVSAPQRFIQRDRIPSSPSSSTYRYDAHGNRIATIQRSGTSFAAAEVRSYGAWGEIRQGATSGSPKGRYCANLGHVQDDESGLIYMRARYYEPASGRFISEDREGDGANWFVFCCSEPINHIDQDGHKTLDPALQAFLLSLFASFYAMLGEGMASGNYQSFGDLGGYSMNALKAAGVAWLVAKVAAVYFGTEGLGTRIPQKLSFWKMLFGAGGLSFSAGVAYAALAALGAEAGKIYYELYDIYNTP